MWQRYFSTLWRTRKSTNLPRWEPCRQKIDKITTLFGFVSASCWVNTEQHFESKILVFGWKVVLRIFFFHKKWQWIGFSWKKIHWNMLCLLCNTTQAADNNKVLPEENKEWFEFFSFIANFLSFYELFGRNYVSINFFFHQKCQKVGCF